METDPQPEASWILQVTEPTVEPVTVAAKVVTPPGARVTVGGATATATGWGAAPFFTRTTLVPLLFAAVELSARTWKVPSTAGAV